MRALSKIARGANLMIHFLRMDGLLLLLPLVIDLGDFSLASATPLGEVAWFLGGLILLAGSSAAILWWNRRAHSDPFA